MKHRVIRSHNCICGFRNEFPVATIDADAPTPPVDMDAVELCLGAGCKLLVPVSCVFRLPAI